MCSRSATGPTGEVIRTAASKVCLLRPCTKYSVDSFVARIRLTRRLQAVGRHAFLHPIDKSMECCVRICAESAEGMDQARSEKNAVVVVD